MAAYSQSLSRTDQTSSPSAEETSSGAQPVEHTSSVDTSQNQRMLLESIRKQTEILHKKIKESTKLLAVQGGSPSTEPPPPPSS